MSSESELFLEAAQQQGKLSADGVQLCREQMKQGIEASVAAVQQKLLTEADVVQIYQAMKKESGEAVYLVPVTSQESDSLASENEKILEYLAQHPDLVSPANIQFCLQEQKRLAKLGYQVQLSAVLHSSRCLSLSAIREMYHEIMGQELAVVEEKVSQSDGMPVVRLADIPKPPKPKREPKPKVAKPAPTPKPKAIRKATKIHEQKVQTTEVQPEETVPANPSYAETLAEVPSDKQIAQSVKQVATTPEVAAPMTDEAALAHNANVLVNNMAKLGVTNPTITIQEQASPEIVNMLNSMMAILRKLESQGISVATAPVAESVAPPAKGKKAAEEEEAAPSAQEPGAAAETSDHATRTELTRGKTVLDNAKALQMLQKGEKLNGYYINNLSLAGVTFAKAVVLTECVLENFDASNAQFNGNVDFEGSYFIEKAIFKASIFAGDAKFSKATFLDGADFAKTEFQGESKFHTTAFQRFVSFNRTKFGKKVVFSYCTFATGAKFNASEFLGAASFNNLHCGHRFEMSECKFEDTTTFSNAEFSEVTDFSDTVFKQVAKFIGTVFAKNVSFKSVNFQNDCIFQSATVDGDLLFNFAKFNGLINLQSLSAEHNVNFKEAKMSDTASFQVRDAYFGRLFITIEQLHGHLHSHRLTVTDPSKALEHYRVAREEYGLLKNNFREINEYDEEDWAYLWEKRTARKNAPVAKRFLEWLVLDIPCGYGTKTVNIFPTLFALFFVFAVVYYMFGSEFVGGIQTALNPPTTTVSAPDAASTAQFPLKLEEAIQVSFCTLTNLSIGDIKPAQGSLMNYVLMFESFLGFLLMNVVVIVTFSRKVSR